MANPPATEPPPEPPHIPADPSPLFKCSYDASEYKNENSKLGFVLFNRIHQSQLDKVKEDNFDSLATFHGAHPLESFAEICETVDSLDYPQLVNSKKKLLNDFVAFLRQKIPAKTAINITQNWQPVVPKHVPQVDSVLNLVVRLANTAKDGNKILYWLSNNFFPKAWGKKSCLMNSKIGAVCRCILPPNRRAYWAILDTDKTFKLYLLKKNAAVLEFTCKVSRTKVHEDGRSVVIVDADGNDAKTFLPVDINQAQMWGAALAKQHSPFPYFMSSYQTPLPTEYYHALYESYTCSDMIIVRCVANPSVTPPTDPENRGFKLMDSLFDIFAHDAKMPLLLNEMAAIDMYEEVPSSQILCKPTNFGNLVNVYVERFGKIYFEKFVSKLIDYISMKDCFEKGLNGSAADLEIPLNTAFKLIYNSANLVPKEIKHVAQVLFGYSIIKYNNKQDTYNVLSNFFFFRFLFAILNSPEVFGGKPQNKNVKGFLNIAKVVCNFGAFQDSLSDMNNRFQKNVFPKIEAFLFSIAQLTKAPEYEGVSKERFVKIIETVLYCISHKTPGVKDGDSFIQFVQRFNDAALATFPEPMILPNNLHLIFTQFFNYRNDEEMQKIVDEGGNLDEPQNYFGSATPEPVAEIGGAGGFPDMPPPILGGDGFPPIGGMPGMDGGFPPVGELPPVGGAAAPKASGGKAAPKGSKGAIPPKKAATPAKKPALPGKKPAPGAKAAPAAKGKPAAKAPPGKKAAPAAKGKPPAKAPPGKKAAPAAKGKAAAPAKKAAPAAKGKAAAPAKKAAPAAKGKAAAPAKKPAPKKK